MKRFLALIGLLFLAPYAYMVWFWGFCDQCQSSGHALFYSFVLLVALPFLLAGYGLISAVAGARAMRDHVKEQRPVRALASGWLVWVAMIIAVPSLFASLKVYNILFPEVEEGRDRLGRICVEEGNSTVCGPDPATREELQNRYNQRAWRRDES